MGVAVTGRGLVNQMGTKKTKDVKITVGIPTYGRKELLKRTVDSVFNQNMAPDEIVLVDDRSPDDTWGYIKSLRGVKAYQNKRNLTSIQNYNETFKKAKNDLVVSLGSDDLLLPNFIEVWKDRISKAPKDVMAFVCAGYLIDGNDRVKGIVRPFNEDRLLKPPETIKAFWGHFQFNIGLSGWTVYNKNVFKKVGYFSEKYGMACETHMTMRILPSFPIYYCATPLFAYRIHDLQAYERHTKTREFDDAEQAIRVLYDYEKKPEIRKSYTMNEQKERMFVRKPLLFNSVVAIFYLLTLRFFKAKGFFRLFYKYYPKPHFSITSLKLFVAWCIKFLDQFSKSSIAKFRFIDRGVLEDY